MSRYGQGQSSSTAWKQIGIQSAILLTAIIMRNAGLRNEKIANSTFFHFDLYCGSGWNYGVNCLGSPETALQAIEEGRPNGKIRAYFVDKNRIAMRELRQRLKGRQDCRFYPWDNIEFIPYIPVAIRRAGENPSYAMGSLLIDPNGYAYPGEELITVLQAVPRIDIAINFNISARKRIEGAYQSGSCLRSDGSNQFDQWEHKLPPLNEYVKLFSRDYWSIREPYGHPYQFTMLIGRNAIPATKWIGRGYYPLSSPEGQEIAKRVSATKRRSTQ